MKNNNQISNAAQAVSVSPLSSRRGVGGEVNTPLSGACSGYPGRGVGLPAARHGGEVNIISPKGEVHISSPLGEGEVLPGGTTGEVKLKTELHYLCSLIIILLTSLPLFAQNPSSAEQVFYEAMKPMLEGKNFALRFEVIAPDLDKPLELFAAPEYKRYRGAYLYVDGDKMDMKFPELSAVSNGILSLVSFDENRLLMIDSVQHNKSGSQAQAPEIALANFAKNNIDTSQIEILGEEMVAGDQCYKLRILMDMHFDEKQNAHTEVLYWISKDKKKLVMFSEKTGQKYKSYLVKSLGKAPEGHNYNFYFPKEKRTELMGYRVMDMRYR